MSSNHTPTSIENKFLSLIGVAAFCYGVIRFSSINLFSRILSFEHSFYFLQFEQHFWQYLFTFVAVVVLSRGHLWSYGINSQNLKTSMVWLAWLYAVTIIGTFAAEAFGKEILPVASFTIPSGMKETIAAMLAYWMSSPVANQILFFGFGQTILIKQWGDSLKIAGIPIVIIFSAIFFTFGATSSQFFVGEYTLAFTFALGMFSGLVYWKTNSLITPMLGHAFYFGFPLFIHILRSNFFR